ncbi:MAG: YbaY family lipoprotein [Pseudomonadota bacterium]
MKIFPCCAVPLVAALLLAGCDHIDIRPEGDSQRVLTGTVNFHVDEALPPDTVVLVRLVDTSNPGGAPMQLGEQTIKNPPNPPVPFRIEYQADDALLRHGLRIEARVSIGGKVRFYNVNGYALTLAKAADPQEVWVNPAGKP